MTDKKSNKANSRRTDPRLKSFLRKAEAVIAAEKGFNTESRLKLQTLAEHLKLPQPLFDEALARLQQRAEPTSNLTRYETAFVKFLDTEFDKYKGGIISPRVENEAIALAKRKYDINGTRAEQLIAARAEAAGKELISRLDAETFGDQLIVDRIGALTDVDDELYDQLLSIGRKWGLSQSRVERIVTRETKRNKSDRKTRRMKPLVAAIIMLTVASALIGSAFVAGWIPSHWLGQPKSITKVLPDESEKTADTNPVSRFPRLISDKLDEIRKSNSPVAQVIEKISGGDPLQRRSGYHQLVRSACSERDANRSICSTLVCELFYADPDEDSALEVLSALENLVPDNQAGPPSVQQLKNAFLVNKLLGQLKYYESDADFVGRKSELDSLIAKLTGVPLDSVDRLTDYLNISEQAIATDQWNVVMQTAWSSPTQAAVLLQPLYDLTGSMLEPESLREYRDDTLISIMGLDSTRWSVLQTQIRRSLETCDDAKLIEWVSIFKASADEKLRDVLGRLMLPRIDVQPASQSREDIALAIENFGLQYRNQVLRPVIDRNELLEKFYASTIERDSGNHGAGILPDRIAQLALAVNVEWAFCTTIENATHIDDSSFAEFDHLIAIPSPRLRELISLPIDRRAPNAAGPTSATASDKRRMNASLERLKNLESNSSSLRVRAFKQLNQIAHRFEGISYAEADTLASYLLSDLDLEESLNVEKLVEAFAHWPNLPLAISDQLLESNVKTDQILTVCRLLLNRDVEIPKNVNWKNALRVKILAAVSNDVENQVDQDPDNIKSNWIRLKIYLTEAYSERLTLGSEHDYSDDNSLSPHQATIRLVESAANGPKPVEDVVNVERAIRLVRRSSANEIEKTVFANQLLIQTLIDELADADDFAPASRLLANLRNKLLQQSLAGDQLYATELALLQVVNLKRKHLVQRLLKQENSP